MYLPNLHLPKVRLRCNLQEKLHRVSGPQDCLKSIIHKFYKGYLSSIMSLYREDRNAIHELV